MRHTTESGTAFWPWFAIRSFAVITLVLGPPAYGQVVGVEAYLYDDIPVPPHAIADYYIERVILPELQPELAPLWLEVKDAEQTMDGAMDSYFSSRQASAPGADLRQTYLRTLLLLKQLRNALVIYEQLSMTPESYSERAGEAGFLPAEARKDYLAKAAVYVDGGDNPQKAAFKAAVAWIHERDRKRGAQVRECYFENPQTEFHWHCANFMMQVDGVFRDVSMAEMFPLDEEAVKKQLEASSANVTEEIVRTRNSIIDVISRLVLTQGAPPVSREDRLRIFRAVNYRVHRESAILSALEHREEYRAALLHRKSQIAQADRETAQNGALSGFLGVLATGAAVLMMVADMNTASRASANAANPNWIGHENDELCYVEIRTYLSGRTQTHTYCYAYNGSVRGISGLDGSVADAIGAMINRDHCTEVNGWCKPE